MSKHIKFVAASVLSVALSFGANAQETTADTVLVTVNGTDITLGHVIAVARGLPDQYQQLPDDALYRGLLDQIIQQTVLAEKYAGPTTAIELQLENDRRSLRASEYITNVVSEGVTEQSIKDAYAAQFKDVETDIEYSAAHILVETEEEALALISDLDGGADFAETAMAKSTGPSGPNGGDLGWFSAGMMVKPFEDAVVTMSAGDVSAPVQTQFGWHVIKLNETRALSIPELAEVRESIVAELQQKLAQETIDAVMVDADVQPGEMDSIDFSLIRDTSLIDIK